MGKTKFKENNKTKKLEEIKDIKPKNLNEEELKEVQSVVQKVNQTHMELGQIEARKHSILHYLAGIQDEMTLLQNRFQDKYGTNDININDGTINYPENGKVNKED